MTAQTTTVQTGPQVDGERHDSRRGLRICGAIGIGAGLLFGAMTVWEHAAGLESPAGVPAAINQGGFVLAMFGYVVLTLGLALARPGGDGRAARFFPALLVGAWTVLIAGALLELFASIDPDSNPLSPIGGLAQGIGLVGLGVGVAVARRWAGWRRFYPLGFAAYFVGAIFLPAVAGVDPSTVLEVGWAVGYSVLGLALLTVDSPSRIATVATAVLSVGVLAAAVLVMTTTSSAPAAHQNAPVVQDGRSGGPDVYEPRTPAPVPDGRWGGPDVFEPRTPAPVQDGRWGGPDVYEPHGTS